MKPLHSRILLCPGGGGGGAPSQSQEANTYDERITVDGDNNVTVRDAAGNVVVNNVPIDLAQAALEMAGQTAEQFLASLETSTEQAAATAATFIEAARSTSAKTLQTAGDLGAAALDTASDLGSGALATAENLNADALATASDLSDGAQGTALSLFERAADSLVEMLKFGEKALKTQADTSAGALNAAGAVASSQSKFLSTQTGQDGLATILKYAAIAAVVIVLGAVLLPSLFKSKAT